MFPPLNTTDYSSYAQQMPTNVDGTFVAVGGAGLIPFLKAYEQAHGPIDGKKFIGNLFWGTPGQFEQLSTRVTGAYVGGAGTAGDLATAKAQHYANRIIGKWFKTIPPFGAAAPQASSTFTFGYFVDTWGLIKGLQAVKGDLGGGQKPLQAAISKVVLPTAYGTINLDKNRAGIIPVYYQQLYQKGGKLAVKTVGYIPSVDQTFGGTFSPTHARTGTHVPEVREAEPAVDRQDATSEGHRLSDTGAEAAARRARRADPPPAGDRPAVRRPPRRERRRPRRRSRRAPRHPRPERRRQDDAVQRHLRRRPPELRARSSSSASDITTLPPSARAKLGMGRTYQKSRLFLGLSVEDNLYLAVLGVREGHLRPVVLRAPRRRHPRGGTRPRRHRRPVGRSSARSSARSRTASSASSRSAWRVPETRR